jgi:hypothetical protein
MSKDSLNSRMIAFVGSTAGGFSTEDDVWIFVFTVTFCEGEEEEQPQINKRLVHINRRNSSSIFLLLILHIVKLYIFIFI